MIESPKRASARTVTMVRGGRDIGSLTRLRKKKKVSLGYKLAKTWELPGALPIGHLLGALPLASAHDCLRYVLGGCHLNILPRVPHPLTTPLSIIQSSSVSFKFRQFHIPGVLSTCKPRLLVHFGYRNIKEDISFKELVCTACGMVIGWIVQTYQQWAAQNHSLKLHRMVLVATTPEIFTDLFGNAFGPILLYFF